MDSTSQSELYEALAAQGRKDYQEALRLYTKLAALGSACARFNMANMLLYRHISGRGGRTPRPEYDPVPDDPALAIKLFEQVYVSGDYPRRLLAALKLGYIYERGLGVPTDYAKAYDYYEKVASEKDSVGAIGLLHLGIMYDCGEGVDKDWEKAKSFYRRSAKLGNLFARKNLGLLTTQSGNIPYGLWLWLSTVAEIAVVAMFNKDSLRFRYGYAGYL
jgi:TPR repeat protein